MSWQDEIALREENIVLKARLADAYNSKSVDADQELRKWAFNQTGDIDKAETLITWVKNECKTTIEDHVL